MARLAIQSTEAVLIWRFIQPPPSPITDISASINGRALKFEIRPYVKENAQSAILLLMDVSGPNRNLQLEKEKELLKTIVGKGKGHENFAFGIYADGIRPLSMPNIGTAALSETLNAVQALPSPAHLGQILPVIFNAMATRPAQRRGVFILSDGHSDDALNVRTIVDQASRGGISVYFILVPGNRPIDRAALNTIALNTGGLVVDERNIDGFLNDPFFLLDSGATVHISLDGARRYFWESDASVNVVLRYGARSLDLTALADVPRAGIGDTTAFVVEKHSMSVYGSATGVVIACGGVAAFVLRRRRRPGEKATGERPRLHVLAALQDIGTGQVYSIRSAVTHIGRATTNEIVLDDETVSRIHAALFQGPEGTFSIENKSDVNSAQVNDQDVENCELQDGDIIGLGTARLRFTRLPD